MKIIEIKGITVQGVSVRTRNADEAQPATARIGKLWEDFGAQIAPRMAEGTQVYGVYHRYESDMNGAFDVLAGTDAPMAAADAGAAPTRVDVVSGPYLVFDTQGPMPQAVIEAWGRIWHYFADPHCPHTRAYTTDFERYGLEGTIEICIAVVQP